MWKIAPTYLQLTPDSSLPDISSFSPFRSVLVIEERVSPEWQNQVSTWLVQSGCLYMMAWGDSCESWHDSVDNANLEQFDYEGIPEEKFILTTWHEDESLEEIFWFAKNVAFHAVVEIKNTLILHISKTVREEALLAKYNGA